MAGAQLKHVEAHEVADRRFRYFDFVMAAFVAILLLSNVIGAGKIASFQLPGMAEPWPFGAGILFFPLSYVIGDVLTEVYGFARARRCIWAGFVALTFMAFMSFMVVIRFGSSRFESNMISEWAYSPFGLRPGASASAIPPSNAGCTAATSGRRKLKADIIAFPKLKSNDYSRGASRRSAAPGRPRPTNASTV